MPKWQNPTATYDSRSPIKLVNARAHWVLAADAVMKIQGSWGGNRSGYFTGTPQHRNSSSMVPDGGNEVFVDGSGRYVKAATMWYLHTWDTSGNTIAYFYQNPSDMDPILAARLPLLTFKP